MDKKILFPFNFAKDNKRLFCRALELAESCGDHLICFTSVAEENKLDEGYLHLLDLFGYYKATKNIWGDRLPDIKKEIRVGVFVQELYSYLSSNNFDLIIADQNSMVLDPLFLQKLILNNSHKPEIVTFEIESDIPPPGINRVKSV